MIQPLVCSQVAVDGSIPAALAYSFFPRTPLVPFYQWENNHGYCGEASLIQSGLANGMWLSQYNARSLASPWASTYSQTGQKSGFDLLAQVLLDDYAPAGTTTANSFGNAAAHAVLTRTSYGSAAQTGDVAGYQSFMSWVKARVVAGDQVTIGVISAFGDGPYDHIVSVARIDSNYAAGDTSYHGDDVIYFDDHGLYTRKSAASGSDGSDNPAIPPGAGTDPRCTPYLYGYTFDSLHAPISDTKNYRVPIPGTKPSQKNYGYSVSGVVDTQGVTLPVHLTVLSNGNPQDPVAGYQYEAPMIGTSLEGESVTNTAPTPMSITLQANVTGLTAGVDYQLYRYDFGARPLPNAPLAVPTSDFNANAGLATQAIAFTASGPSHTTTVTTTSDRTIVFRAVPASAP
jgi:hypothetical protein